MSFVPSRPFSFPRLSCIALLVASLGLTSCGGDDDDNPPAVKQADQVGTLHGVLAAALQEELGIGAPLTNLSTPVDALQDIVILSDPNGIHDAHPALPLMKNAFYSGRAVVLENVNAKEVHALIKALGVRISAFSLPEGDEFVELFAVRKVKGDTWFFVDVGTNLELANTAQEGAGAYFHGDVHDSCNMNGDTWDKKYDESHCASSQGTADGEEGARQQAQCEAATQALGAPSSLGPTLAKAIRAGNAPAQDVQDNKPPAECDNANSTSETVRSRALLDWAQQGREEAGRAPSVVRVKSGSNDNDNGNGKGRDYNPLLDLASQLRMTYTYTPGGRSFQIVYNVYSYHSFEKNLDYYFIQQYGSFNPKHCWKNVPVDCGRMIGLIPDEAHQYGHILFYEFEHALKGNPRDSKYGYTGSEPVVVTRSPGTDTDSVTVSTNEGVSLAIGFKAGAGGSSAAPGQDLLADIAPSAEASLSAGISTNTSRTTTFKDATVTFDDLGRHMNGLNWKYDFLRPCGGEHVWCPVLWGFFSIADAVEFHNLQDAVQKAQGAIGEETVWHEWTWAVPSKYSQEYFMNPDETVPNPGDDPGLKGFMTTFVAMDGQSDGDFTSDLSIVAIQAVRHKCKTRMKKTFYVPVQRPPLLALDQQALTRFPVNGGQRIVNLASEYYWKIYEKPDWVRIGERDGEDERKGGPTNAEQSDKDSNFNASKDLWVTVREWTDYKEEDNLRQGYIKVCAIPAPGDTSVPDENGCLKGGEEAKVKVTQVR